MTDFMFFIAFVPEVGEPDALQHRHPGLVVAEEPWSVLSVPILSTFRTIILGFIPSATNIDHDTP